jgi:hypothetical protein
LDILDRLIDERIEAEFGWMRRVEIVVRAAACVASLLAALALAIGLWQPSTERVLQCALALALSWAALHLLRSIVGALSSSIAPQSEHLHG